MIDEQHTDPGRGEIPQDCAERRGLVGVESGRGLVEQHELRSARQRPGDARQATPSVGQFAGSGVRRIGEAEGVEDDQA